uniref:MADS-box domain-containing protein n=1 Tax=Spongospora subterranea TaxID=70186 RepID=A0A0H5R4G3_9EUKA|eukprot:CRZ09028.1 hypothetical protein [Spongospora subterranea]
MGRKKILIHKIDDVKNREVTFNKRKVGLMKKAIELSVLCDCEVAVVVFHDSHLYQYSSDPTITTTLKRYMEYQGPYEQIQNEDLDDLKPGKASSFKVGRTLMKHCVPQNADMATVVMNNNRESHAPLSIPIGPRSPLRINRERRPSRGEVSDGSLLEKRGRKRALNVHIPMVHDSSSMDLVPVRDCLVSNGLSANSPRMHMSHQMLQSVGQGPCHVQQPSAPLFSPSARYVRGPLHPVLSLPHSHTPSWSAVPCMSPHVVQYTQMAGGGHGPGSALNTPTLSPFATGYPPFSHNPPSPSLQIQSSYAPSQS